MRAIATSFLAIAMLTVRVFGAHVFSSGRSTKS